MFFILSTKQNAGVLGWPLKLLNCKCYKVHLTHEWIAYFCALTGTPFWLFMHHHRFSYGNQGYKAAVWWQHCSLELGPNCPYCFSHKSDQKRHRTGSDKVEHLAGPHTLLREINGLSATTGFVCVVNCTHSQ